MSESGLIDQRPFFVVFLLFRIPGALSHDDESEQNLLVEMLEGTLHRTPQVMQ